MRIILNMILLFYISSVFGQKMVVEPNVGQQWSSLTMPELSKDGKYVIYEINNPPKGVKQVVLQSTNGLWKKNFKGYNENEITDDSKYFFYSTGRDTLVRLTLGTDQVKYDYGILSWRLKKYKGSQWICYFKTADPKTLLLKNVETDQIVKYLNVSAYEFSDDGSILLLWKDIKGDTDPRSLYWVDIKSGKEVEVWQGKDAENLIIDAKHQQLVFQEKGIVWFYKDELKKAVPILDFNSRSTEKPFGLSRLDRFSENGENLFLTLVKDEKKEKSLENVEIWSYQNAVLPTEQASVSTSGNYLALLDLKSLQLSQLQLNPRESIYFPTSGKFKDKIALTNERWSSKAPWSSILNVKWSLLSVKSGERKALTFLDQNRTVTISPTGKYLIYHSYKDQAYFSYEIASGTIRNLTKGISVSWKDSFRDDLYKSDSIAKIRGDGNPVWLNNDESFLVYDTYDIWKIDPLNRKKPKNLTNGYGRSHHIVFNVIKETYLNKEITDHSSIYLTAFNLENKDNGFFKKQLDQQGDPEQLKMGPFIFCTNSGYVPDGSDFLPIKARNAETYIVRGMSTVDAPNYFSTKDFKTLTRLSNLQPQKAYNWYTSELHTWKSLDGRALKGILYKPENFNPDRKYPVIFYYYERLSDGLNTFFTPKPLCAGCAIDIPTYVSHGYLVFCPDIYYKVGDPMQGTYDAVVSAAKYVSGLPFVNSNKLGIQGCSFGGLQTNYLVTHTGLFAAAVSTSGLSDMISAYGSLMGNESSLQGYFEGNGEQARIGSNLWQNPEAYIKNSPLFQIDKVSTPLLMMHTKDDGIYKYANALEFFLGLRRMGKKAWMLAYANENHGLFTKNNANDFSTRMMQFFDHYLKDKPAPVWMTRDFSAGGSGNGYEYDTEIKTPGPGLIVIEEQGKTDFIIVRK